jgi:branched-chain amino acid transport system substrate-binding protein
MSKTWTLRLGLVLLAAAFSPAAVGNAEAQQPIKIGYLSSLSGPFTPWGILVRDGMKLAVAEVNAAGGVEGRPLELVERDDRNNPSEAVTAFQYMVERGGVIAVGGIISSDVGLAVSREAEAQKVPLFLTMSGSDAILTKESRYTFRTCLPAAPMNMGYIAGLIQENKYTRIGAIVADYAWGHSINDAIDASIKPLPGVKLQVEVAPVSERDFTPYLRKLQDFNPELLIATGHPPGSVTIARQAIELGMGGQIIGPWFPTEFTVERGGEAIFGRFIDYTCAAFGTPDYERLAAKFHSASKHLLDINGISGYAIIKILTQTITEKKSTDPKVIADAVRAGRFIIPGYGWPLSYTEWGEMKEAAPILYTYEKGSPPDDVNPGANWRTKVVFRSKPVQPYVPGK